MNRKLIKMIAMAFTAVAIGQAAASDTSAQIRRPAATNRQIRTLLTNIDNKSAAFKRGVDNAMDRTLINSTNAEDRFADLFASFQTATGTLRSDFNSRRDVTNDVSEVLDRAAYIDRFMTRNRMNARTQSQWSTLRTDLDTLAGYYRVSWNWDRAVPAYPGTGNSYPGRGHNNADSRITGTYRLNTRLSDDVTAVIDRSVGSYATGARDNMRRNLERRLASPQMIAIDRNNRTITMGSSNSPQVTFEADGIGRTETNQRGRTITTTATTNRNGLEVSYVGDRTNDFYVTFDASNNDQLKVTRKIYLENRNEQVTATSVYDKISAVADWPAVNSGGNWNVDAGGINDFHVPNGVQITAVLNNPVDTKVSQVGDRFTMNVTSPAQYRGAVIEGHLSSVSSSGRVSGRANLSMDFDTIRLANGSSYRFAGMIDSVRAANGDSVTVNNEGTVRDSSQTTKTVTRAGIGAVLGAVIGAIAGGGQGAAIGAGVGAGAGAGSVLVTGRDSILLSEGSEFRITASAPSTVGRNQ